MKIKDFMVLLSNTYLVSKKLMKGDFYAKILG